MSILFFQTKAAQIPQSDTLENVRSTVTRVDKDADASVATGTPERNLLETDPSTDGGLTTHQVASQVSPAERYAPSHSATAHSSHEDARNNSWSAAGTAAAREASGQWGHGTAYSQDAMTRIPDGTEFREDYFQRDRRGMNEHVTPQMMPLHDDPAALQDVSDAGREMSREPNTVNIYQAFYNATMGVDR